LLLEVFTQRNFSFFSKELEFYWQKQQNRVLCHPLEDLWVTYTVHHNNTRPTPTMVFVPRDLDPKIHGFSGLMADQVDG